MKYLTFLLVALVCLPGAAQSQQGPGDTYLALDQAVRAVHYIYETHRVVVNRSGGRFIAARIPLRDEGSPQRRSPGVSSADQYRVTQPGRFTTFEGLGDPFEPQDLSHNSFSNVPSRLDANGEKGRGKLRRVEVSFSDMHAVVALHDAPDPLDPSLTAVISLSAAPQRMVVLRWFAKQQVLEWKRRGEPVQQVGSSSLERGWTFEPTAVWAALQMRSFALSPGRARVDTAAGLSITPNNEEGCDDLHWLDDTIFRRCCDEHDRCYEANGCNARSWWFRGSWACIYCNMQALQCFRTIVGAATSGIRLGTPWNMTENLVPSGECSGVGGCPAYCYSCT